MSKRRTRPRKEPITTFIDKLSHDGRGIARINGKATFIQGALPDETVNFQYTRQKKDFDEGYTLSVVTPSHQRVAPHCAHYEQCGGCSLQHLDATAQIQHKQEQLLDLLARTGLSKPQEVLQPLISESWHYRNKARLSVRFVEKKNSTLIGFREKNNPRFITDLLNCSVLNAKVAAQILPLRSLIDSLTDPKSIAQIEVAAGDEDVALIFRNLTALTAADEEKLRQYADETDFRLFLQPGGEDSVYLFYPQANDDFLTYSLPEEGISFRFHPTDFTQVNSGLNQSMVQRTLSLLSLKADDRVLDLFCGLGNFSLPMAKYASCVTGVEGSARMVLRAQMNAKRNGLTNTTFFAANLEEEGALAQVRKGEFNKILLDPPRTGALTIVKQMDKLNPDRIVYVSCNPATLARDTDVLVNTHGYKLIAAGVMDMFPHTAHVESIALFEK